MGRFGKSITGAIKKITGLSSRRSYGSLSMRYTEHEDCPMHEDEETMPTEEEEQEQEQPMEEGDDDPHLDLEGEWEMQVYDLIKNREFIHTLAYDPNLLEKIGMETEFATI
jgi:hypothetical protein